MGLGREEEATVALTQEYPSTELLIAPAGSEEGRTDADH